MNNNYEYSREKKKQIKRKGVQHDNRAENKQSVISDSNKKEEEFIAALEARRGNVAGAAKLLGKARSTVCYFIQKSSRVKQALEDIRETTKDLVDSTIESLALGERNSKTHEWIRPPNPILLMFYAKCKMKDRGYMEKEFVKVETEDVKEKLREFLKDLKERGGVPEKPKEENETIFRNG